MVDISNIVQKLYTMVCHVLLLICTIIYSCSQKPAGRYGDFECDLPNVTLDLLLDTIKELDPQPDFIVYTGGEEEGGGGGGQGEGEGQEVGRKGEEQEMGNKAERVQFPWTEFHAGVFVSRRETEIHPFPLRWFPRPLLYQF